jgi:hypothetical protein
VAASSTSESDRLGQPLAFPVDPAEHHGELDPAFEGQLLLPELEQDGGRLREIAGGLGGEGQSELGLLAQRGEPRQVGVGQELGEAVAGLGDLSVLERQPRVTEGELDVLHLLGGHAVDQIGE